MNPEVLSRFSRFSHFPAFLDGFYVGGEIVLNPKLRFDAQKPLVKKAFFRYGRRYGRGSPRLSWPIFPKDSRNILGNWGLRRESLQGIVRTLKGRGSSREKRGEKRFPTGALRDDADTINMKKRLSIATGRRGSTCARIVAAAILF